MSPAAEHPLRVRSGSVRHTMLPGNGPGSQQGPGDEELRARPPVRGGQDSRAGDLPLGGG